MASKVYNDKAVVIPGRWIQRGVTFANDLLAVVLELMLGAVVFFFLSVVTSEVSNSQQLAFSPELVIGSFALTLFLIRPLERYIRSEIQKERARREQYQPLTKT